MFETWGVTKTAAGQIGLKNSISFQTDQTYTIDHIIVLSGFCHKSPLV